MMKKTWRYILIIVAGFILLIVALLLFTQTSYFKEKARIQIIKLVENQLNLQFDIEKIEGNWYNHITVKNIVFSDNDDTVATFQKIKLNYQLIPLSRNIIRIDSVILVQPKINLWQKIDSSWNIGTYIKVQKTTTVNKKESFNFEIDAKNVSIKDGSLTVQSFSKLIPMQTSGINLSASGNYSGDRTKIVLSTFMLNTENPSIQLKNLSAIYNMDKNGIQVDSLLLLAGNSNIDFNGEYQSLENLKAKIISGKIDKDDLSLFVPTFKLLCSPSIKANFSTINDTVSAWAELHYKNQSVFAEMSFSTLSNLMEQQGTVPYSVNCTFTNFKVTDWIESKGQRGLLNGDFQVDGENLLDFNTKSNFSGQLKKFSYNGFLIDALTLSGIYEANRVETIVDINSRYGNINLSGDIKNINKLPQYKAHALVNNANLTAFIPELIGTKLSGIVDVEGQGFSSDDILANAKINLFKSTVYDLWVDSLQTAVNLKSNKLIIDSIQLHAPGTVVSGKGSLSLDSLILKSSLYADIESLEAIKSLVELPIVFDSATTAVNIWGPLSTLQIEGDVNIFDAEGYSSKLKTANGHYAASIEDSLLVKVNVMASNGTTGSVTWNSAWFDFAYVEESIDLTTKLFLDENTSASATTQFYVGDTLVINIPSFEVKTIFSDFYLSDTMKIQLYELEKLKIENLVLKDRKREDFDFQANGTISNSDSNQFQLFVKQFDISLLNQFFDGQDSLKGYFEGDVILSGTSLHPIIKGNAQIIEPEFGSYAVSSLKSNFEYENQMGTAEISIPEMDDSFYAKVDVPFNVYIDSLGFVFDPPKEFNGDLRVRSIDLSELISSFMPNESIKGLLNVKINASGEIKNPLINGNLSLTKGQYLNSNLGINYDDIKANVDFGGKSIRIDTFVVKQKGGLISVTGEVEFDSTLISGNITSSSLQLDANKFWITKHRNYQVLIDAKTFINTGEKNPEFGGKIKVIRSDVFLPALMKDSKTNIEHDVPMLVKATKSPTDLLVQKTNTNTKTTDKEQQTNKFIEQLTGRVNVEIPKNTWIRSNDMRIELSGKLEIVKTGPFFEIFGNVDVVRGYYILYGRKLNITDSQIIFQGGEELNPTLNIETEYVYRGTDKEKRYLNLRITGELSEPKITFILDGAEITETDGVSILIFGATSDEIGYGAQNGLAGSVGSSAVTNLLTSQLSRTIGTQFNLDMIEIRATENWQSAAFVVGKYITNDLFVIYQRGFGEVNDDEITPETIILEYELNDKLFLRLQSGSSKNSGLDVILKFEQELERSIQGIKKE